MKDIVITVGSAKGSALALIRAIKKEIICDAYVLCTDPKTAEIISASKFVKEVHLIVAGTEKEYVNEIKKWYVTKVFDVKPILYFTFDNACYYIDNHRQWFDDNFTMCLPSSQIIQTFTQKGKAESAAINTGLTVPRTQIVDTREDVERVINSFSFPIIIKPRATYLKGDVNFKIKVFADKVIFIREIEQLIDNKNSLLCQEFIPGGNDAAWYYLFYRDSNGIIYNNMGRKTLQSSSNGGFMLKGRSEYNEDLTQICHAFLDKIDYRGIGGVEFKYYNNKYYFIEMSTRLEGFYQITEDSGVPLSIISYYDLSSKRDSLLRYKNLKQKDGIEYVDLIPFIVDRKKSKKILSLAFEILDILFSNKTNPNVYSRSDKKPFFKLFLR